MTNRAMPIRHIHQPVRPPLSIQFELTFRCNLNCLMCYNGSGPARPSELTDDEWIDIVRQAIAMGIMEAIISGGEPLLRGQDFILGLLTLLTEASISSHLITNGSLVTESFVRNLRGLNIRFCQTSIDGPNAEIHNAIRGGDNFDKVTCATHLISSYGLNSRVGTTIQRGNENYIQEIIELAISLGAHDIVIDEFLPIGRSIANYQALRPRKSRMEIIEEARYYQNVYKDTILIREGLSCKDQLQQQADLEFNDSIIIRPDGELRLGCMAPFSAGNARREGLANVWNTLGATAWKTEPIRNYIQNVQDNQSLRQQHLQLGIMHGYENICL